MYITTLFFKYLVYLKAQTKQEHFIVPFLPFDVPLADFRSWRSALPLRITSRLRLDHVAHIRLVHVHLFNDIHTKTLPGEIEFLLSVQYFRHSVVHFRTGLYPLREHVHRQMGARICCLWCSAADCLCGTFDFLGKLVLWRAL